MTDDDWGCLAAKVGDEFALMELFVSVAEGSDTSGS